MHDLIKGRGDTMVLAIRRWGDGDSGTGALGLVWSIDGGTSWTVDWPVNDGLVNDPHPGVHYARYPTAIFCPDFPAATWPTLRPGAGGWSCFGVGNEPSWTSTEFYGLFPDSLGTHKSWAFFDEVSELIVGASSASPEDEADRNCVWSYDPGTGDFDSVPTFRPELEGFSPYAYDYRNGDFLLVGFDSGAGLPAFATSEDGLTWTLPNPMSIPGISDSGIVHWIDGAFLPNGDPAMVVLDFEPPDDLWQANEVWFVRPDTAIRIDRGMDTYNHYSQFTLNLETDEITVVWCEATHEDLDPSIDGWWHDVFYATSNDGGFTWSAPENYTNTSDVNEVMVHVARYNRSMIYATALSGWQGDLYYIALLNYPEETLMMVDIGLSYGVEEETVRTPDNLNLQVLNYLNDRRLVLKFTLHRSGPVEARVFDAAGRCVLSRFSELETGDQELVLETSSLMSGTYVVRLEALGRSQSGKFVIF
jgi:hypothetical protein